MCLFVIALSTLDRKVKESTNTFSDLFLRPE